MLVYFQILKRFVLKKNIKRTFVRVLVVVAVGEVVANSRTFIEKL